jgi:hypothetical protein
MSTYAHLRIGTAEHLETVKPRTPVNECLDPKKEAPSFKGAFLVLECEDRQLP